MICLIFQDSISQLALILFSMSDFAHSYMSILLYHHKQLVECSEEVEQIEVKVTIKKRRGLTKSKEESEEDFPLLQPPAPARQLKLTEFKVLSASHLSDFFTFSSSSSSSALNLDLFLSL